MTTLFTLKGPVIPADITDDQQFIEYFMGMSPLQAGKIVIDAFAEKFPELTWNDFLPENFNHTRAVMFEEILSGEVQLNGTEMSGECEGFWGCTKAFFGDVKNTGSDIIVDSTNFIADKGGDLIRLATDEEVVDGASRIGSAYATSGGSEGLRGFFESLGASSQNFLGKVTGTPTNVQTNEVNKKSNMIWGISIAVGGLALAGIVIAVIVKSGGKKA